MELIIKFMDLIITYFAPKKKNTKIINNINKYYSRKS